MKKSIVLVILGLLIVTGCTSYNGIQKTEDGDYYIITNKHFFGVHPGIKKCKAEDNGDLTCRWLEER